MITEVAPAKLNLALHVRARRADGYHELETLFAFCRDGDVITLAPAEVDRFALTGPFGAVLVGDDNLVTRARDAFRARFGADPCAITLDKRLPIASGIGGGSADAAATLRALARWRGVAEDDPALFALAEALGADVPACLLGRAAIGTGKGEKLAPIAGLGAMPALLVNPGVAVSTAAVFKAWDGVDRGGQSRRRGVDRRGVQSVGRRRSRRARVGRPARGGARRAQRSRAARARDRAGDRARRRFARRGAGGAARAHVGLGRDLLRLVRNGRRARRGGGADQRRAPRLVVSRNGTRVTSRRASLGQFGLRSGAVSANWRLAWLLLSNGLGGSAVRAPVGGPLPPGVTRAEGR